MMHPIRRRLTLLAILPTLALAACGPTVIVMRNPQTGEIKQCGQPQGISRITDAEAASSCAKGYTAAGWQRMN